MATDQYLQYILELDICGYALPRVPRMDLSYAEKIDALREYRKKWQGIEPIHPTMVQYIPRGKTRMCCFVDGTYARICRRSSGDPYGLTRTLWVYQLPSLNRGTAYKCWSHDLDFNAKYMGIQPAYNLLVLLEENVEAVSQIEGDDTTAIMHERFRLHLRSLATNKPHPVTMSSARPTLDYSIYTRQGIDRDRRFHIMICGRLVALLLDPLDSNGLLTPTIVVWNWVSGEMIVVSACLAYHLKRIFNILY